MMTLIVKLEMPEEVKNKLRADGVEIESDVQESYALDLYRRGYLEFHELSRFLEKDHLATSELLQRHRIYRGSLTMEDLENDVKTLQSLMKKAH